MDKKKKIILIGVICVAIVVIVFGVFWIFYENNRESTDKTEDNFTFQEGNEKEINDSELISKLSKIVSGVINIDEKAESSSIIGVADFLISSDNGISEKLSDDTKLFVVLENLNDSDLRKAIKENSKTLGGSASGFAMSDGAEGESAPTIWSMSIDKVKSKYKEYFGEELSKFNKAGNCEEYTYDSEKKEYVWNIPKCSVSSGNYVYVYKNKYSLSEDGKYAYAYVNFGSATFDGSTYTICKDYNSVSMYKEKINEEEAKAFRINESNYKDFAQYRFVFEKGKDGNFALIRILPVEEETK